jgi:IS1 family transposase
MHPANDLWLLTVLLWLSLSWLMAYLISGLTSVTHRASPKPRNPKSLRPRSEDDCPHCRTNTVRSPRLRLADPPPPPWHQVKSPRGRKKSINTEGYACRNAQCPYRLITDARVHALVGDGFHGHDHIPDLRCQACHRKFSARRDTALYRLRTPAEIVETTLALFAEGAAPDALQRVYGIQETTQRLWRTRAGLHAQSLHEHFSHDLQLAHIQLDELFTTARQATHDLWLWVALDVTTKFIPAFRLGPRTQEMAHHLIHQVRQALATSHIPVFSSDGLKLYFYALTAHFGQWLHDAGQTKRVWCALPGLLYAQVQKIHRRRRLIRVNWKILCGSLEAFAARLQALGLSGRIQTAFIERLNLTLRRSLAPLARRSWSTAQLPGELQLHLEWWRAYYHFVRPHQALRQKLDQPYPRGGRRLPQRFAPRTPAMAIGFTQRPWSVLEVLSFPLPNN